ncbi:MAG: hypothetical protein Q8L30_02125 [bacterium]|nr:hypothetical protein [bacterium]
MSHVTAKITTFLTLISFIAMAFLSLSSMSYGAGGMQSDCPFSISGSLCPSNALPGAVHHLSAFQAFLSAPTNLLMTVYLLSALILALVLAYVFRAPLFILRPAPIHIGSPPVSLRTQKKTRWLSLLNNSPSRF